MLRDDHELLGAVALDGERGTTPLAHGRRRGLDRRLDVLREQVATGEDDHLLETSGDVELTVAEEAEIPGAQERSLAGVGEARSKRLVAAVVTSPVTARDARAAHPDLADPVNDNAAIRIHDANVLGRRRRSAAHERAYGARAVAVRSRLHAATVEGRRKNSARLRERAARLARDEQRRLGEPVARQQRGPLKARGCEGRREALEGRGAHGLGAAERDLPAAQVKPCALLLGRPAHAQVVCEVRSAARRRPEVRDRLEPAPRSLQKRLGRHQHNTRPDVDYLQHVAETHVVEHGQPADDAPDVAHRRGDRLPVRVELAVAQHRALGRTRRPRRVLDERDRLARQIRFAPLRRQGVVARVGRTGVQPRELGHGRRHALEHRLQVRRREHEPRAAVGDDPAKLAEGTLGPREIRWVRGNRDHAAEQASEERRDEVGARRVQQQRAIADGRVLLEGRRDRRGTPRQVAVGQLHRGSGDLAGSQVAQAHRVAQRRSALLDEFHERLRRDAIIAMPAHPRPRLVLNPC